MSKIQAPVITNETPANDEYGIVVRPIGGSGGGDVTIIAPLPLPVTIADEPVDVNIVSSVPIEVEATDLDIRDLEFATDKVDVSGSVISTSSAPIVSTVTGTLDGNGDIVVLELNGAKGASALFPNANDFSGTIVFETSNDGGIEYNEVQANAKPTWEVSNPLLADVQPSNSEWIFVLSGGETHVQVRVTSYASGSAEVTITGTDVASNPVQNATFAGVGGNRPVAAIMVGGRDGNEARPVQIRGDADGGGNQGFVTWDQSGTRRLGAPITGANDFGKAIGGKFSDNTFEFVEIRDVTPAADTNGAVVRHPRPSFDSGLVELTDTLAVLTALTILLTGILICNLTGAAHTVTVTNTAGDLYLNEYPLQPNMTVFIPLGGITAVGVKWNADANAVVNAQLVGETV